MTNQTNEMDSAAYVAAAPTTAADTMPTLPSIAVTKDDGSPPEEDPGNEIGMDITMTDTPITNKDTRPANVSVYANNITPVSVDPDNVIVYFDVVFSVSIQNEGDDRISTHQVVKRIGVDKMKIANDAKLSTPSIVEAQKPKAREEAAFSAERIKALAGIK